MSGIRSRAKETIDHQTTKPNRIINGNMSSWTNAKPNVQTSAFTFHTNNSKPVLVISSVGEVEWHGRPSQAADVMVKCFQLAIEDKNGFTKAARRRYYLSACQNILNKAKTMEHEEFIDFLQKQVYNREKRVIYDSLKGTE